MHYVIYQNYGLILFSLATFFSLFAPIYSYYNLSFDLLTWSFPLKLFYLFNKLSETSAKIYLVQVCQHPPETKKSNNYSSDAVESNTHKIAQQSCLWYTPSVCTIRRLQWCSKGYFQSHLSRESDDFLRYPCLAADLTAAKTVVSLRRHHRRPPTPPPSDRRRFPLWYFNTESRSVEANLNYPLYSLFPRCFS